MSNRITIEPSGHEFTVEQDETVLNAALRQGVHIGYGCRSGACGACKGKIVSGEVSYREPPIALSDQESALGMAILCKAYATSDLVLKVREIAAAEEITVKTLPCRVERMEKLSHDVMRLYLKLPASERLPFFAGQYIDIVTRSGRRRPFSLANAPHDDKLLELHIRYVAGGDFTEHVFGGMKERELLRLEGPRGGFTLREESDKPIIFMAGGTGFAPVKSILEHAFAENISRPIHLYWGARTRADLYLDALPRQWAEQHKNFSYTPVLSQAGEADAWEGRTGYVHEAILQDHPSLAGYEIYACGSPAMVKAGSETFLRHGLAPEDYLSDAFELAKT